ncbi:MAG: menaquinone biosynthesis decarboxylase [Planctomycetes bacterium]|nr:menaquinone biosynthesis decarboxylase [Planctomycetota bacterium]MCW8136367.1 menaquinone biosynthesis decarboxylase [Planctomycetota bacterium]
MPYADLPEFIQALRDAGELVEFREPVSVDQEIACIADRVSKLPGGGPALLFHKPTANDRQYDAPVLINALGSERRLAMMCGVESFDGLRKRLSGLLETLQTPRRTLIEKLQVLPTLKELSGFFPRYGRKGPCREVVTTGDAVNLDDIPILKTWPQDGGRFVTYPLVFTESPADGKRNCGMYRIQQYDARTTGFHVHTHHTAAEHMRQARARGQDKLPAAVCIGGEPALTFAAVVPLPPGLDEMILAGFLQGKPVTMVPCETIPQHVPASCDYVIEGWIHINERRREGPFGDHTGFYSLADDYPVFHVSAITRRRKPTYFATVVGPPPQEDAWITRAIERLFLPLMQQTIPEVIDYRLPFAGVAHNLMLVKIHKAYPGQARKVAHAVWGLGQAAFTKVIVVIDQHGPALVNEAAVAAHVLSHLDASSQFEFVLGPTETLDHATRALHFGSKVAIDATRPMPGEPGATGQGSGITGLTEQSEHRAQNSGHATPDLAGIEHTRAWALGKHVFVIEIEKSRGHQAREIANEVFKRAGDAPLPLLIVLQAGLAVPGKAEALAWATLANIDPERDLLFDETPRQFNGRWILERHPRHIAVDATRKDSRDGFDRDWPEMQLHPPEVLARARELLQAKGITMPE